MARLIAKPNERLKQKWRRLTKCAKKYVKWSNKEESESVWFSIELEVSERPEIYLSGAKNVEEPTIAVWPFAVRPHWESYSTLFWLSLPSNKLFFSLHTFDFSFLVLSLGWKVFSLTIFTQLYDFFVFLLHFLIKFWRFFINWSFVWFSSLVSHHWVGKFFNNNMVLFEIHQHSNRARIFSLVTQFSSSVHFIS